MICAVAGFPALLVLFFSIPALLLLYLASLLFGAFAGIPALLVPLLASCIAGGVDGIPAADHPQICVISAVVTVACIPADVDFPYVTCVPTVPGLIFCWRPCFAGTIADSLF